MSKFDDNELNIYLIGKDYGLFEKIFTNIKDETHKSEFKGETKNIKILYGKDLKKETKSLLNMDNDFISVLKEPFKKRFSIKMIGYKYPELSEENNQLIIFDAYNTIKSSSCKKNIIISFETNFINKFCNLNNKIETEKPFMIFNFSKEEDYNDNIFNKFKCPQYISYFILSAKNEPEKLFIKIISYILEKISYYNERGNELNKYLPNNILEEKPKGFLYLNILLTGESRAGKSSFINRVFNKLVSFESSKLESTTLKINEYELYPSENEIEDGYGGIKFFDTPGLVKNDKLNSFELIKDKLNKIFNEIHLIYFFIKGQGNLEESIDMLKYIKNINIKREKENLNKIPIIFIKNGEDLEKNDNIKPIIFQQLKNFLKKYDLIDLYDSSINQNINKIEYDAQNFFDEDNDDNKNYDNYIDGNFIQIYIPKGKNINKIFSTTKDYIIKNNNMLYKNDISQCKGDVKKLINFYIKENLEKKSLTKEEKKLYNEIYSLSNENVINYKNNCSILYNLNILDVKSKFKKYMGMIGFIIFLSLQSLIFPLFIAVRFNLLYYNNIIDSLALNYGFGKKDLIDYGLNQYIYKNEEKNNLKENEIIKAKKDLFEDIIYYIGPIQCLLKSEELFFQIIKLLINLNDKNEEEWNKFHVEKKK